MNKHGFGVLVPGILSAKVKALARDPICGMTVDLATALPAERDGETSYFCCDHCRRKFESAPAGTKAGDHSFGAPRWVRERS